MKYDEEFNEVYGDTIYTDLVKWVWYNCPTKKNKQMFMSRLIKEMIDDTTNYELYRYINLYRKYFGLSQDFVDDIYSKFVTKRLDIEQSEYEVIDTPKSEVGLKECEIKYKRKFDDVSVDEYAQLMEEYRKYNVTHFYIGLKIPTFNDWLKDNHGIDRGNGGQIPISSIRRIKAKSNNKCQYPGCELTADVVKRKLPWQYGGDNNDENLIALCSIHEDYYSQRSWLWRDIKDGQPVLRRGKDGHVCIGESLSYYINGGK